MNQLISSWLTTLNGIGGAFWSYAAGMFVQSGVLILSLLAIDLLLRKRVRATFRYWMWMLVFVKLILPPTLSLPTGIGYWFGDHLFADSIVLDRPSNAVLPEPVAAPAPQHRAMSGEIPFTQPSEVNLQPITPAAPAASRVPPITSQAIIFLLWLAGASIISILVVRRIGFVRQTIAQSASAEDHLLDVLNQCRREVGVRQDIQLRLSTGMPSPAVCGLFKPTILIPAALGNKLSPEKLRAVLIHELAHIKRGDLWVNSAQTFLQIVYLYNPLVWLANAVLRRIREQAVDEMVLVALGTEAKSYSNTLIDIAEVAFFKTSISLRLIGVVESKRALHGRIRHMLNRPIPKSSKVGALGTIAIILIAGVLLPMARAEKSGANNKPAATENKGEPAKSLHQAAADRDTEQVKSLLSHGADVNARDETGCTALHCVAKWTPNIMVHAKNWRNPEAMARIRKEAMILEAAELLISKGAQVNVQDDEGNSPLHHAVKGGHKDVAELLIGKGANVNARNQRGFTPIEVIEGFEKTGVASVLLANGAGIPTIHVAALLGDLAKVKAFIDQGVPVDAKKGGTGKTALFFAARAGQKDVAKFLIDKGADVNSGILKMVGNGEVAKLLIANGANVNGNGNNGWPLRNAAASGRIDVVKVLLANGADTEAKDGNGQTALSISMTTQCKESVLFLVANGADVNTKDRWGQTPLHYVARRGWRDAAEALIAKGADVEARTKEYGDSPLYFSTMSGHADIVELLIGKGADPLAKYKAESDETLSDETLSDVALEENHKEVVRVLAAKGAADIPEIHLAAYLGELDGIRSLVEQSKDVEKEDKNGKTPLSYASLGGNVEIVRFLIDQNAKLDAADEKGMTPLHYAAFGNHKATVRLLLAGGADINGDSDEGTPLHMAISSVSNPAMSDNDQTDMAELLIDKGADINVCSKIAGTPLHLAVGRVQKRMVKLLIAKGADVNAKGGEEVKGGTPLHATVFHPYGADVAVSLIRNGADVNARDNDGATLLHLATQQPFRKPHIKLLLDHGADVNARDNRSRTPLVLAKEKNRYLDLLREYGAKE